MTLHSAFHRARRLLTVAVAAAMLAAPDSGAAPTDSGVFERPAIAVGFSHDTAVPSKRVQELTDRDVPAARAQGAPRPAEEAGAGRHFVAAAGAASLAVLAAVALPTRRREA